MTAQHVELHVNGTRHTLSLEPGTSLLTALRDHLRLSGTKESCGRGECGTCTVRIGGRPALSCVTLAALVDEPVETIEHVADGAEDLRALLADHGGFQCGFCTSGQVVLGDHVAQEAAAADGLDPTAIAHAMSGVICRCTGGRPIVDAVVDVAARRRGERAADEPAELLGRSSTRATTLSSTTSVGARRRPNDWRQRTSGASVYVADVELDGLLEAAVVRSPWPYAEIVGIDADAALRLPGVHAVLTAADFPKGTKYLHGADSDRPVLADGVVRYIGQDVAVVAADTKELAREAAGLVRVRYKRRRGPTDVRSALRRRAAVLHDRATGEPNVSSHLTGSWGEGAAAWDRVTDRVTGEFYWPRQSQAPMEPQSVIARWDGDSGTLELWVSTQAPMMVAKEVARLLDISVADVRCHDVAVGGGFGAKSKVCEHEVLAARLSQLTGRPVRLVYDRNEEFAVTKTRHPFRVRLTTGVDAEQRITALHADVEVENGAYNHYGPAVMRVGIKTLGSIYDPKGASWDARLIDTATQPAGPFRGYGAVQVTFATEQQIDELAEKVGVDPIELRRRNANLPGTTMLNGSKLGSARFAECLDAVREAIDWDRKKRERRPYRGVGVAAASHGSGSYAFPDANRSEAAIDVDVDGRVSVRFGGADAGTGQRTLLAQIAGELLGLDPEQIGVEMADLGVYDQGAWSSRGTHMGGHAVRVAAEAAAEHLRGLATAKLGTDEITLRDGLARSPQGDVELGDLVRLDPGAHDGVLTIQREWLDPRMELYDPSNPTPNVAASYTFAAHACEVEVDPETGVITVVDYVAAHDIGRALNPTQTEGQIIGGVAMGLGAALSERLLHDHGRTVNPAYVHYGLPRSGDVPPVRTILVEGREDAGPFDAKSVAEMSLVPAPAALANAVYDAIGIRFREVPLSPDRVLRALAERHGRRPPRAWRRHPHQWWVEAMRRAYPLGLHWVLHNHGTRFARRRSRRPIEGVRRSGLVGPGETLVGGGTDVMVQRQQGLMSPVRLVSTRDMAGLRELQVGSAGDVVIGGAVTLAELAAACSTRLPMVAEAVGTIASEQLRTTATVAGNLLQAKRCWYFRNGFDCYKRGGVTCPCYAVDGEHRLSHAVIGAHRCQAVTPSDLATVFVALDATAHVRSPRGDRMLPIAELYTGPGESVLGDRDVLVGVHIAVADADRTQAFEKLALWDGDFAACSAAVTALGDPAGTLRDVRVVLGAVAPTPWRARGAERAAAGVGPGPARADRFRRAVDADLEASAHPLRDNAWKLDAVAARAGRAMRRLDRD